MANTYTQINIHLIFAVKGRERIISQQLMDEVSKYIHGILTNLKQYPLAISGHKNHIHLFFELNPATSIADIAEKTKANSSKWINNNNKMTGHFQWQRGYGGFSYSKSQRNNVIQYIMNQQAHHTDTFSFRDEYLKILTDFGIQFKNEYLFEFYD